MYSSCLNCVRIKFKRYSCYIIYHWSYLTLNFHYKWLINEKKVTRFVNEKKKSEKKEKWWKKTLRCSYNRFICFQFLRYYRLLLALKYFPSFLYLWIKCYVYALCHQPTPLNLIFFFFFIDSTFFYISHKNLSYVVTLTMCVSFIS